MRVVTSLATLLVLCQFSSAFDLPNLGDFFNNLMHTKTDDVTAKSNDETHSRSKRQNPDIGDESQLHYEVKCSALPTLNDRITPNSRYMPTLGNGHISTTVYNDSMYMNGLYNGAGGLSHRAKIPSIMMARISLGRIELEEKAIRKFTFNVQEGYFLETIDSEIAYIEHRLYIHQKYIRLFVSDIYAVRKNHGGTLYLSYPELSESADITFGQPMTYYGHWQVRGQTNTPEEGTNTQPINIFYMNPATEVPVTGSAAYVNTTMVMSLDRHESSAQSEFETALNTLSQAGGHYQLFSEHKAAWKNVWEQGRVEVEGDTVLAKLTTLSQYYILSSMPAPFPNQAPQHSDIFYGVGRNSLAKGGEGRDYQGHVMWDNEMHILPTFILFHPNTVKKALRYRSTLAPRAMSNAEKYGGKGYHFPWESGFHGEEVSPEADQCPECSWHKYHVTGAVAWLIRIYYSATRDRDYRQNIDYNGCDMTREIARFFADRAVYNPQHGRYDILDCTGPDENHPRVANNAYTLVLASLAIHYARYFSCLCQRNEREEVPDEWVQKALYLNLPFDNVKRLHYQHDDYDPESLVRQADTVMLAYPLNWNMSSDIMKNDLLFYEQVTDTKTPGLTWSFFTVGFKWVDEDVRMQNYFLKSYQDYQIQPFKIWTEFNEQSQTDQDTGSVNFLPGMGGFLQSLVFGFAGVRIRPEMIEFHRPIPPPGCTKINLIHMKYLQSDMTVTIEGNSKVTIQIHDVGEYPLILRRNNTAMLEESLPAGAFVEIDNAAGGFFIYTTVLEACDHPRDFIYMPWGYSPWVDGARELKQLTALTVSAVFISWLLKTL